MPKDSGLRSKKGNAVLDSLFIIVILFVAIISIIIARVVLTDLNTDIQADATLSNLTKSTVQAESDRFGNLFDGIFIFVFVLLWIAALIASFMIDTHPIFLIFTLILMIFVFIVAAFMGNVYEEVTADSDLATAIASFPMANYIWTHMLIVIICVGASMILSLFAKNRWGS